MRWEVRGLCFYIRSGLGVFPDASGETEVMVAALSGLNIPVGNGDYGTSGTAEGGGVQCGMDDYQLPNGMKSGELKDRLEEALKAKKFVKRK